MYLWFKLLHVAAVVAFLGNIGTGAFWHAHATRTRDPKLLAHTMDGIIRSDRVFTLPGVAGIVLAGFAAAGVGHLPILHTGWIVGGIVLFVLAGAAFMARVAPLQRQLLALARAGADSGSFDYGRYRALARQWQLWGTVALVTPLIALALMVLKPAG
jgi:uncharacterized membrane protein